MGSQPTGPNPPQPPPAGPGQPKQPPPVPTEDGNNAFCVAFRPTIWHRLGFGANIALFEDEEAPDMPPGAITCDTYIKLDWKDRLRVLFTGCLMVAVKTKTNVVVDKAISRSAVGVLWPAAMPPRQA